MTEAAPAAEGMKTWGRLASKRELDALFKPLKVLAIWSLGSLAMAAFAAPKDVVMTRR